MEWYLPNNERNGWIYRIGNITTTGGVVLGTCYIGNLHFMHEFYDEVNVIREIFMEIVWGFIAYFRRKR